MIIFLPFTIYIPPGRPLSEVACLRTSTPMALYTSPTADVLSVSSGTSIVVVSPLSSIMRMSSIFAPLAPPSIASSVIQKRKPLTGYGFAT